MALQPLILILKFMLSLTWGPGPKARLAYVIGHWPQVLRAHRPVGPGPTVPIIWAVGPGGLGAVPPVRGPWAR